MKTEIIDFKEVVAEDLMGERILLPTPYQKDLGNKMYVSGNGIEMADLGRKIFYASRDQEDLLLNAAELTMLIEIYDVFRLLGQPLHVAIKEYLSNKLEILNKEEDGNNK